MVEKIPVRPESVRGLGNIISPAKTLEDFSVYNSSLSYVDGFYTMEYVSNVSVTLTSDKSILSYADGDSATLTVTVLEDSSAVSGETVEFYRYVDGTNDVLLGSDVTDSNGEATYSYASAGIGDVELYAKVRTLVSKRYDIEDCVKTHIGTYLDQYSSGSSTTATFNDVLDSTFKIEFDMLVTQSNKNSCFFRVGETDSKALLVGKVGSSDTNYKIYARNGTDLISTGSTIPISNDWTSLFMTYNGTTFNFNDDISITNLNGISLTKLLNAISYKEGTSSVQIRNIKIKPL